ncbi:MAG: hypothetical protein JNM17_02200, partial [Archangium sp.]|nr:hypothetical protein [Archangium sp.]
MLPPRPYTISPIMAACDSLAMEPDLLGPGTMPRLSDDVSSLVLPLPFAFQYWGSPVTHYSVSSNGFAQLHASAAGPANSAFNNVAMPNIQQPNAHVALMWSDLVPGNMTTSNIRVLTTGMAPTRRFTVQWNEFAYLQGGTGPERITFQMQLFEMTNVIEMHYCSMLLNGGSMDRITGGISTIGVENANGTDAVQHSHRTPGSVFSGQGLRFSPP